MVANGKVYMPTHDNAVAVYGLLPPDFILGATQSKMQIAVGRIGHTLDCGACAGHVRRPRRIQRQRPSTGATASFSPSLGPARV